MAKYKVAIIGSTGRGDYGHGLDAVWQRFDDCEVVAVADQDTAGLQNALARTGATTAYADYRAMLGCVRISPTQCACRAAAQLL